MPNHILNAIGIGLYAVGCFVFGWGLASDNVGEITVGILCASIGATLIAL